MTIVVGVDLSLTGTGLALYRDSVPVKTRRVEPKKLIGHPRLNFLLDEIVQFVHSEGRPDLVVMEGPSFASFDANGKMRGAWWIVKHRLWEEGLAVGWVPPTNVKKYATGDGGGKGKIGKAAMVAAVNGESFPLVTVPNDDEADAVVLACMGLRWLGLPADTVPVTQARQIEKGVWPGEVP